MARQPRLVHRQHVAAMRHIGADQLLGVLDHDRGVGHALRPEQRGDVLLGRAARQDADAGAVQIGDLSDLRILPHHETRAGIEGRRPEVEAQRGVTGQGDRRRARQHVDFTGLQRRKALHGAERSELDLLRITENGRGDGAAEVRVQAFPMSLAVRRGEPVAGRIDAADDMTPLLDGLQRRAVFCGRRSCLLHKSHRRSQYDIFKQLHSRLSLLFGPLPAERGCAQFFSDFREW